MKRARACRAIPSAWVGSCRSHGYPTGRTKIRVAPSSIAAAIGVWLATPPSMKSRRPIVTGGKMPGIRSEEHTSELQSPDHLVCRLLLEKKKTTGEPRHHVRADQLRAQRHVPD